jgi:hypothetical protein
MIKWTLATIEEKENFADGLGTKASAYYETLKHFQLWDLCKI